MKDIKVRADPPYEAEGDQTGSGKMDKGDQTGSGKMDIQNVIRSKVTVVKDDGKASPQQGDLMLSGPPTGSNPSQKCPCTSQGGYAIHYATDAPIGRADTLEI
ncbi:hypothetical protein PoB_004644700 [Plakobranchus ocellatus]|uniref:Uncharacterized protein n=1 Tax=Plakobranchus ocellatus TaxID=259542 RepID=A0AAV4BKV6_9GAST|nr:hypothetical protein PoB_004644700 [Plakobranchus ocellatus]